MSTRRNVSLPSFVLGYHGCDQAVADRVIGGWAHLRPSRNDYDWLGEGVYFWEGDPTRAKEWATDLERRGLIRRPAVVGAVIDPGTCLDLFGREYLKLTRTAYDALRRFSRTTGQPLPRNTGLPGRTGLLLRRLDCAVINYCQLIRTRQSSLPPFDTVRAAFVEGDPLYPEAGFNSRNHIQVCVVNPRCVRGYFRPQPGGAA